MFSLIGRVDDLSEGKTSDPLPVTSRSSRNTFRACGGRGTRCARRILSADLSRTYAEYLAAEKTDAESPEDALIEAHADIAALGLVPALQLYLDAEADKLAREWLNKNHHWRLWEAWAITRAVEAMRLVTRLSTACSLTFRGEQQLSWEDL